MYRRIENKCKELKNNSLNKELKNNRVNAESAFTLLTGCFHYCHNSPRYLKYFIAWIHNFIKKQSAERQSICIQNQQINTPALMELTKEKSLQHHWSQNINRKNRNIWHQRYSTTILCSGEDLQLLLIEITAKVYKLKKCFDKNKLSLNLTKTEMMSFWKREIDTQVQFMIDNVVIERVCENKFLGVLLDHEISWKPQVSHIQSKMARSIADV